MSKMPLKMQRRLQRANSLRTRFIQHICLHAVSVSLLLLTLLKKILSVIKIAEYREKNCCSYRAIKLPAEPLFTAPFRVLSTRYLYHQERLCLTSRYNLTVLHLIDQKWFQIIWYEHEVTNKPRAVSKTGTMLGKQWRSFSVMSALDIYTGRS